MDIDNVNLSVLPFSELNFFFTNLARSEQMKDIDMKQQTSKMAKETDEDVASTTASVTFSDGLVSLKLHTNENNTDSIWKSNFFTMAFSILPSKLRELAYIYKDLFFQQLIPYAESILGGVAT